MNKNTVFIIGAGASKEVNLPTGYELKNKLAQFLDINLNEWGNGLDKGDDKIFQALRLHVHQSDGSQGNFKSYQHAAWQIRDGLPVTLSIDNLIYQLRENKKIALCGKLAIVRSILDAEQKSLLYFDKNRENSGINFNSIDETWYIPFFQLLTENCKENDLESIFNSFTLIVFNYDRCIEHFIYHSLIKLYWLSKYRAAELVKRITIYHPYGVVGSLPWIDQNASMEFGTEPSAKQLLEISSKIKTFTEGADPNSSEISGIQKHMDAANRIVFLGFAFHKLNMKLITPSDNHQTQGKDVECFATTYKISDSDKEAIKRQINILYNGKVKMTMTNLPCKELFKEFWRSLSF
jgi:hypothetical protein